MNQRTIIIAVAAAALALFAGASLFYMSRSSDTPQLTLDPPASSIEQPAETPATSTTATPEAAAQPEATEQAAPAQRWNVYVRQHSPVIGPANARVTIVEFFDPACEACRAFYPIVHEIMRRHPNDVRLVLRYTPLHQGSEEAVRILETARMQNKFEPVLTALFDQQPRWADDRSPQTPVAWEVAQSVGLDVTTARAAMNARHINSAIRQDMADINTLNIRGTPTFYVNEQPLAEFSPQGLYNLVLAQLEATQ